jgi:hypothetical protein
VIIKISKGFLYLEQIQAYRKPFLLYTLLLLFTATAPILDTFSKNWLGQADFNAYVLLSFNFPFVIF